jgi:hypothetical protein
VASARNRPEKGLLPGNANSGRVPSEKNKNGTLLLLTESGFDRIPEDRRLTAFRANDGGWTEQMKNIENYVAQNP